MLYFDAAATTLQKPPQVARAVARTISRLASPGRGGYAQAQEAQELLFSCRSEAGTLFSCDPSQVVFTMNATHGLNLAIKSLIAPGNRVVISGFEHNAVTRPLHALGARVVVAGGSGLFDPIGVANAFDRAITRGTKAVICTQVSNVFGFRLPVEEISELCRERNVPLILDASQAAGCCPVTLGSAAFVAMPGHKGLYGPQGTGLLLCGQPGTPLLEGGTGNLSKLQTMPPELPERLEAGTQNVCGIAGLLAGLQFVKDTGIAAIGQKEAALRKRLISLLPPQAETFTGKTQTGVLSLRLPGLDCEEAGELLGQRQIAVRAGLHCAPLAHESAGTLETGTIRVSFSYFNTAREVETLAHTIRELLPLGA